MKHSDYISKKRTGYSGLLAIIVYYWYLLALIAPNVALSVTEGMCLIQNITNIILPLGVYWMLFSLSRNPGKSIWWMFIFAFFGAFQLVLIGLYGKSVLAVDMILNVLTTNVGEATELLAGLMPYIILVIILYGIPLIAGVFAIIQKWQLPHDFIAIQRRCSTVAIICGAVCFILSFFSTRPYKPLEDLFPVNVFDNVFIAAERTYDTRHYHQTSQNFSYNAHYNRPDSVHQTVVMVIGETSRAMNWQLAGYNRPTNPGLSKMDGLHYYRHAISESNTTHKSVPMLLSPLNAATFNDSINKVKSIITAFKEAGFQTAFLSAQRPNNSYIDFFGHEADTAALAIGENNPQLLRQLYAHDFVLIDPLKEVLESKAPRKFIVLHTYGSHYNYSDRYNDEARIFTPESPLDANPGEREKLINAYDNTIAATDSFLCAVIDQLNQYDDNTVMLYTSDHGEDIYDDSRNLFLHASPVPSIYQIYVPFIVWTNREYADSYPEFAEALTVNEPRNLSSSDALFHTALQLGNVTTRFLKDSHSLASKTYTSHPRIYLTDHNKGVPLKNARLETPDFEKAGKLGLDLN